MARQSINLFEQRRSILFDLSLEKRDYITSAKVGVTIQVTCGRLIMKAINTVVAAYIFQLSVIWRVYPQEFSNMSEHRHDKIGVVR